MVRPLAVPVLLVLALMAPVGPAAAGIWIPPGDSAVRHDLQLLIDHRVLPHANASSWPVPQEVLSELDEERLMEGPAMVREAWMRLSNRLSPDIRQSQQVRTGAYIGGTERFRPFHASPRERGELEFRLWEQRDKWSWRINITAAGAPSDSRRIRLDGSHLTVVAGNWLLSAGALSRWWGPGHDGSLILSNNARPRPGVSLQRASHRPFGTRWLSWLGPWDFSTTLERADSNRPVPRWFLFGARLTIRPLPGLEIGLVRSAQWGGEGRPQTLESFYDMLRGASNLGDRSDDPDEQAANQFAGYEARYRIPGPARVALYGQYIGIDEWNYLPHKFIGLFGAETWGGRPGAGTSYRVHVEYSDTLVGFHRTGTSGSNPHRGPPYRHGQYPGGYRFLDRALGHPIDSDSRMLSTGLQWMYLERDTIRARLWYADVNRTGRDLTTIGEVPAEIGGLDLAWRRHHGTWSVEVGSGLTRTQSPERRSWDMRGYLNIVRALTL